MSLSEAPLFALVSLPNSPDRDSLTFPRLPAVEPRFALPALDENAPGVDRLLASLEARQRVELPGTPPAVKGNGSQHAAVAPPPSGAWELPGHGDADAFWAAALQPGGGPSTHAAPRVFEVGSAALLC